MERSLIRGYHFTMLPGGAWTIEGETHVYTGPCDLALDFVSDGSVMRFPDFHAHRTVTFTLPDTMPAPAQFVTPGVPAAGPRYSDGPLGECSSPVLGKRRRSPDTAEEAIRARNIAGASQIQRGGETEEVRSAESRRDVLDSTSDPVEDDADCVEVICIEDSVEVIDLVSDSEMEEDPSECSSALASSGANY